jgi:hypothetical protein
VLPAEPAVFFELQAIRRVALILGTGVTHLLAIRAFKQNLVPHDPDSFSNPSKPETLQNRPFPGGSRPTARKERLSIIERAGNIKPFRKIRPARQQAKNLPNI